MRRTAKGRPLFETIAEDLGKLGDVRSRARYIARRRECRRAQIVSQLIEASRTNLRIDARKSLSLADAAIAIARRLRRKNDLAIGLRSKGNALYVLGENQDALKHHGQALRIFRITGDAAQQARTLNASIQPHILLGQYDKALEAASGAGKIFAQLGDKRHLAHLQINTGNIYHRQDRFEEALASYQQAYDMLSPLQDSEGLAVALYNISVCLIALNDFRRALVTYRRARKMCAGDGMTLLVGQADYNIAYLYYLRGEFTRAITLLQSARELASKNGDEHILALCYLDLSDIYLELNLHTEARETAREGFRRFEKLGMGYERAKCIANEGLASGRLGDASRALKLFVRARAAFVREKNQAWPWLLDLYRALVLYNEGEFAKARKLCEQALEILETSTLDGKAALCGLLLARIDLKEGNGQASASRCEQALRLLSERELPAVNFKANLLMGQAQRALGNENAARSFLRKACEALEALRLGLHKDELKVAFMENRSEVYECLLDLCMNKEQGPRAVEEAFGYVEAAKSRALMELMCQGPEQLSTVPAQQGEQDRQVRNLRAELHWYYRRIEQEQLRPEENSAERVKRLKQEASAREKALARSVLQLPALEQDPELTRGPIRISLQEVQSSLGTDTLIVEYFAVEDRLIAALVSAGQSRLVEITKLSRVMGLMQMLRFQLSRLSLGSEYASRSKIFPLRLRKSICTNSTPSCSGRSAIFPRGSISYLCRTDNSTRCHSMLCLMANAT
jgi:tetratricopeptide (TPR) repeat protein